MTSEGVFVVEVPLRTLPPSRLQPEIVETAGGAKEVSVRLNLPHNVDPQKLQISVKDRDLIVHVYDETVRTDVTSKVYYFNRTRLPDNADTSRLMCVHEGHELKITAPLVDNWRDTQIESKQR